MSGSELNGQADYEVIIAGGGYAGLAAARALGRRALVIEQHEIGAIQHSACATPVSILDRFALGDTILQTYPDGYVHTATGSTRFRLDPEYCLFDHRALCQSLLSQSGCDVLRGRILGLDGKTVRTTAGDVRGGLLIDATGWPAALATARRPSLAEETRLTIGLEAEIPGVAHGIHFYFDPALIRCGYAWLFPGGDTLRIGIGAYAPKTKLATGLQRFLDRLGFAAQPARGGRIPWFDRPPVVDDVILVGDAAGQCVPLTAEGIRFAFHFGDLLGRLLHDVLIGTRSLESALAIYREQVKRHRQRMALMRFAQGFVGVLPNRAIHFIADALASGPLEPRFMRRYAAWSSPVEMGGR